jgi:steroid 5-alpha reductase family enzyme
MAGVALWLLGLAFESVGDAQLAALRADPHNRGKVMDRGLWSWTRHPNYFGDACVAWGVWLVVASAWPGVLTILSPVAMTYFLVFGTGAGRSSGAWNTDSATRHTADARAPSSLARRGGSDGGRSRHAARLGCVP